MRFSRNGKEFEAQLDGTGEDFIQLLMNAITSEPDLLDIFRVFVEIADNKLNCSCDNCAKFQREFKAHKKDQHSPGIPGDSEIWQIPVNPKKKSSITAA